MSNTERKHGERVLAAARRVGMRRDSLFRGMFTINELMGECEFSRPTATKYIKMCIAHGLIKASKFDNHMTIYRFVSVLKDGE